MSQSLRFLRLPFAVAAVTACSACMSNPFAPGNAGEVIVPKDSVPIANPCLNPANNEMLPIPGCPFRH